MRRVGERDIVAHRAVEQHVFLQHDADLPPQPGEIDHGEIDAIDQDAAALRHVEPLDELGKRAFARAGGTDNADDLAGRNIEADIVQHLRRVDAIAESDMLESDLAADRRECGAPRTEARLRHGIEDVAEPRDRQTGLMEVLPDLRQAQHRAC